MSDIAFAKINLRVRDLDAAVDYARDVLGATVLRNQESTAFGKMSMVQLGGLLIEILAPASPDSPLAQIIERRGEGVDSLGFTVSDLSQASDSLEGAGARMIGSQGGDPTNIAWLHPRNPLSLSLELIRRDFWNEAITPR